MSTQTPNLIRILTLTSLAFACTTPADRPVDLLAMKARCAADGKKAHDELSTRIEPEKMFVGEPEFAYNEKLRTCLYADSYGFVERTPNRRLAPNGLVSAAGDTYYVVRDLYSNRVLAEYAADKDSRVFQGTTKEDFEKKRRELMGAR